MSREFFTFAEILAVAQNDLPNTERSLQRHIQKAGWRSDRHACERRPRKDGGDRFHLSLLPGPVQLRLKASLGSAPENRFTDAEPVTLTREALWKRFEALPEAHRKEAQTRLDLIGRVDTLALAGSTKVDAIALACGEAGVSVSTYRNWCQLTKPWQRADWLAALAPQYRTAATAKTIHTEAWAFLKSDWLRPEKPSLASCYRRMTEKAKAESWQPIPTLRTVRRWIEREVPRTAAILKREKGEVAKQLYPAQRRTVSHLHAMQAVNIDGHKFDVFVDYGEGKVGRPVLLAIQDVFSRKIVAWRLDRTENKELVRLTIGDMVERHGIPEKLYADNGRAFASKWITGGSVNRYRYKVRDEDPEGLLTAMGVEVHFTQPYHGQAKPIERSFRDMCDDIARHPFCAGAYAGNTIENAPDNRGGRAIGFDLFKDFVDAQIGEHNARSGRNTETARGRSFDAAFAASLAKPTTLIPMPTEAQRRLWLLAAEQIPAQRGSGEIILHGTRYWCDGLSEYGTLKGPARRLTVRYDPQDLARPVSVYGQDGKYLFDAPPIDDVRFDDVDQARQHMQLRKAYLKAAKAAADAQADLKPRDLADMLPEPAPHPEAPVPKKVRRLAVGSAAIKQAPEEETDFDEHFSRAMKAMDDGKVLRFRKREE